MSTINETLKNEKKGKIIRTGLTITAAIALIVVATQMNATANSKADVTTTNTNQYKEEIVTKGDIIVGVTESGSADMIDTTVSYDFATQINEVYIKPGQYVTEGELIASIEATDYSDSYDEAVLALEDAQLSYESTLLSSQQQKLQAELDYEKTLLTGNTADEVYMMSTNELELQYQQILDDIEDYLDDQDDLEDMLDEGVYTSLKEDELREEISQLEDEIIALEIEIEHVENCTASDSTEDATGDETGEDTADSSSTCTNPEYNHDLPTLYKELAELESDLIDLRQDLSDEIDSFEETAEKTEEELDTVEEKLVDLYTQKESYEASMALSQMELDASLEDDIFNYENAEAVYENELAQIENSVATALRKVTEAQEDLNDIISSATDGKVLAPVSGYVMSVSEEDTELNADGTIATLAGKDSVNVLVSIAQEDISDITLGQEVTVLFDAYDEIPINAVVDSISISPSGGMSSSVNYSVTVACDLSTYEDIVVYQGMTSSVTFIQKQQGDVLLVSNKCISNVDGKQYVKMFNDAGEVISVEVVTGFSDGFDVEIVSGLEEGDVVLIESAVSTNVN